MPHGKRRGTSWSRDNIKCCWDGARRRRDEETGCKSYTSSESQVNIRLRRQEKMEKERVDQLQNMWQTQINARDLNTAIFTFKQQDLNR